MWVLNVWCRQLKWVIFNAEELVDEVLASGFYLCTHTWWCNHSPELSSYLVRCALHGKTGLAWALLRGSWEIAWRRTWYDETEALRSVGEVLVSINVTSHGCIIPNSTAQPVVCLSGKSPLYENVSRPGAHVHLAWSMATRMWFESSWKGFGIL